MLIILMPVINAHGQSAGVWATLCTANGFERVLIPPPSNDHELGAKSRDTSSGKGNNHAGSPCPASHFSYDTDPCITPFLVSLQVRLAKAHLYQPNQIFNHPTPLLPRAPPTFFLSS
ncbi:hypothetical protein [Vibrio genomosp. F10]|uniref:Uncharacterized protein n=2 Tax=Vibrio genomosp. F10 TaxID=723171 RepID=A0A1B9QZM2_9VIBR|nr:hypothetical protein [Vibrio genomosp. F10]OCH76059.1 hypothetical protein A6E14_09945 [Vibrio genomosp. F10]OEE35988.1 hypothetical protein A1QO_19420 [Vibrio genomosp. F10 str. ZF-129]OEE96164.1 hypothetical protein A1QM_17280 [Vibrio genomosp. F10 str. 9ZC157]OEF09611.1 hypothetical protein A1QI_14265 [Vibrio genomosp. F10 str. 9ZB36]